MSIDLATLYVLAIGTLCVAAPMTLWERKAHPERSRELGIWAAGFALMAVGCIVMLNRRHLPGFAGPALTNVLFLCAYLQMYRGAACLDARARPGLVPAACAALALAWLAFGAGHADMLWLYVGSSAVSAACLLTARTLWRSPAMAGLRSRPVAAAIFAAHGLFYLGRVLLMPGLVALFGKDMLAVSAEATMFEGVLFSVAAPMALLAMIREESQSRLLAASRTDYLTGLGNRRALFESGERLLGARAGTDRPVTLIAFDLDHFKAINDRHGHAAGDEIIKLFARTTRSALGAGAVLARLGGEEFAAILPGRTADEARPLAREICRRFASEAGRADGLAIAATVSIGLVEAGSVDRDLSRLLSAADRALYRAKSLGRNRIETGEPESRAA